MKRPVALIVLDGYGIAEANHKNAIAQAKTPFLDSLMTAYPHTLLGASGEDVGLPAGQMGNSEVGHTNLGAGRVVYQELSRITRAVQDGGFYENPQLLEAVRRCKEQGTALHLMGLLSDGGVHSHISHLYALLELAKRHGLRQVYVHAFLDGRDCPPASGLEYLAQLIHKLEELDCGSLATVMGRYFAMDRDNRWERVQQAYDAMTLPPDFVCCGTEHMEQCYAKGVTDEFVPPAACCAAGRVQDGDSVVFFNFRPDRARELTRAFTEARFSGFVRQAVPKNLYFVCMTQYDESFSQVQVAFGPHHPVNTLGEVVAKAGLAQLRIAETEKYAHVTFFFSGGREEPFVQEKRVLVPSPKVATYDLLPQMSAPEVARRAVEEITAGTHALVVLNFANCDMVGHTGNFAAAVQAVEAVDTCLSQVVEAVHLAGGVAVITADHGNADEMLDEKGGVKTSHTTNPVPLIVTRQGVKLKSRGILADVAPTVLELMGLPLPEEMSGSSLLLAD